MNREWTIRPQTNREWTRIRNANGRESNHKDEPQTNADERHINPQITQNLSRRRLGGGGLSRFRFWTRLCPLGSPTLFLVFTFFLGEDRSYKWFCASMPPVPQNLHLPPP